jgi:hypothetical protein
MIYTIAPARQNTFHSGSEVTQAIQAGDLARKAKFPWSNKLQVADEHSSIKTKDDMTGLFVNLAGRTLPEAIAMNRGSYMYFEIHGNVSLELEERLLSIDGPHVKGRATFFASEATPAILNCAQRYLVLLKSIPFNDIYPRRGHCAVE